MSGIVLSSSVRQNLLSLQSTADLLATTQNRLSTGKKVNTALDNPTNYFTAASLDNRASDINNLLDGIGNGVQVLQAANTGITSLQKLVDSAKSVATQALQATVGYSTKSSVNVTINGATSDNLLGTGAPIDGSVNGANEVNNQTVIYTPQTGVGTAVNATNITAYGNTAATLGGQLFSGTTTNAAGSTLLSALTDNADNPQGIANNDTLTVNGKTITFQTGAGALTNTSGNAYTLGIGTSLNTLVAAIDTLQGNTGTGSVASTATAGKIQLNTGLANDLSISGPARRSRQPRPDQLDHGNPHRWRHHQRVGITIGHAAERPRGRRRRRRPELRPDHVGLPDRQQQDDQLPLRQRQHRYDRRQQPVDRHRRRHTAITMRLRGDQPGDRRYRHHRPPASISLTTSTTADISLAGSAAGTLAKLGLSAAATTTVTRTAAATPAITCSTLLSGASSGTSNSLATAFACRRHHHRQRSEPYLRGLGRFRRNHIHISDTVGNLLTKVDVLSGNIGTGAVPSSVTGGHVVLHTGVGSDLSISSSNSAAFAALGFSAPATATRGTGPSQLNNLTLSFASTGGGTATNLTFGTSPGQVHTLNDLNNALASNNLQATLASNGTLTITTSNDAASSTIGTITGTAAAPSNLFNGLTITSPVVDPNASSTRNNLVTQYNNILNQITTTAQDASFNGVNLLAGDTLKLTFNETGKSTLSIPGVNFNAAGLGLATLNTGDFKDNDLVNTVVAGLASASNTLRSQASAFGSNLSIVQIRQDFSKNLINVLQTGSSNLTLADTNEEAANSQALSTRQSIAVSALALANQSQQSVLQLLR